MLGDQIRTSSQIWCGTYAARAVDRSDEPAQDETISARTRGIVPAMVLPRRSTHPDLFGRCWHRSCVEMGMNSLYAAPLGLAAALVGTLTGAAAQAADEPSKDPVASPAAPLTPSSLAAAPAPDLLAPDLSEAAARLEASDPAKACDDKCKVLQIAEATLPNTGAADLLSVVLQPEQHSLSIPKRDGTPALTITVVPTKLTRGEGLVAMARF